MPAQRNRKQAAPARWIVVALPTTMVVLLGVWLLWQPKSVGVQAKDSSSSKLPPPPLIEGSESSVRKGDGNKPTLRKQGQRPPRSSAFDFATPETLAKMSLPSLTSDGRLTSEIIDFLGLSDEQAGSIEAAVNESYRLSQEFAAQNVYIIEENDEYSSAVIEANPKSAEIEQNLENVFEGLIGENRSDFLWRTMSGRFQSDLANFGRTHMVVRIQRDIYGGDPGFKVDTWNIKEGLFASASELIASGRVDDPSIVKFHGSFRDTVVPQFLRPIVDPHSSE